jgi:hypothetical protein
MTIIKCSKCGETTNLKLYQETDEIRDYKPDFETGDITLREVEVLNYEKVEVDCLTCFHRWKLDTYDIDDIEIKDGVMQYD